MKPLVVLSLFDGMSCGQIALERAGIPVKAYYASEIDKYAIQITQKNYPNTVQLGDIECWKEWKLPKIDLILAGSPCQGFSNAGKGLNFDDPRSRLFFVFCDILAYYYGRNPDLKFLLENVKMKKEWQDVITDRMKTEPVMINSALVSAQNRERLYWANWTITQPEDKGIYLKDIVEPDHVIDRKYIYSKYHAGHEKKLHQKSGCFTAGAHSGGNHSDMTLLRYPSQCIRVGTDESISGHDYNKRVYHPDGKGPALNTGSGGNLEPKVAVTYPSPKQIGKDESLQGHDIQKRVYHPNGKSPTLLSMESGGGYIPPKVAEDEYHYRKLTPLECERLQTVPENYTACVSNTRRYHALGNGWTIDVIVHALNNLKETLI